MKHGGVPAVVVAEVSGRVREMNLAATGLLGEQVGRSCWDVVGELPSANGLPCAPGCVGRLARSGADRSSLTRFEVSDEPFLLACVPVADAVACIISRAVESPPEPWEHVTPREREVLVLVAAGLTSTEIAAELGVRPSTVRAHLEHMRDRLGVKTRAALVARALRTGLLR